MGLTIRHIFNVSAERYWTELFFNQAFNQRVYEEVLRFNTYKVIELRKHDDGRVERRIQCEPRFEAPTVIKKALGGSFGYVEEGRFDPKAKRWRFKIVPARLANRIRVSGQIWVEPRGEYKCERTCTFDLSVKIFGIGDVFVSYLESQLRSSYDQAAKFSNDYLAELSSVGVCNGEEPQRSGPTPGRR